MTSSSNDEQRPPERLKKFSAIALLLIGIMAALGPRLPFMEECANWVTGFLEKQAPWNILTTLGSLEKECDLDATAGLNMLLVRCPGDVDTRPRATPTLGSIFYGLND